MAGGIAQTSTKVGTMAQIRIRRCVARDKKFPKIKESSLSSRDRDQRRGKRDIPIQRYAASGPHQGQLLPRLQGRMLHRPRCLEGSTDGSEQRVEHTTRLGYCIPVNHGALTVPQRVRCRAVQQPELRVRPDGINVHLLRTVCHAHARTATKALPVLKPMDSEFCEDLVDGKDKLVYLLVRMTGRNSDAESFLAASDGRVVDGLNVDVMLSQKLVGCSFSQRCVTDKDRDNMRGTRSKRKKMTRLALLARK